MFFQHTLKRGCFISCPSIFSLWHLFFLLTYSSLKILHCISFRKAMSIFNILHTYFTSRNKGILSVHLQSFYVFIICSIINVIVFLLYHLQPQLKSDLCSLCLCLIFLFAGLLMPHHNY